VINGTCNTFCRRNEVLGEESLVLPMYSIGNPLPIAHTNLITIGVGICTEVQIGKIGCQVMSGP